jgi:hypothetical protein
VQASFRAAALTLADFDDGFYGAAFDLSERGKGQRILERQI